MSKVIIIKLKKIGNNISRLSITDSLGNILSPEINKSNLISGVSYTVDDNVYFITLTALDKYCYGKQFKVVLSQINPLELAVIDTTIANTGSLWKHLIDTTIYNTYYGTIYPYTIEYPFAYNYQDEILQNVQEYAKVYKYLPSISGVFDSNRKIQTDTEYFNKAVVYNDQQSSGILELVNKPQNNLKEYSSYPKYNSDSKTVTFTKSDNFYQFNTFWNVVKDKTIPLFVNSCESLSIDKEVNQDNMDYSSRSFRKETIRAKDVKVRLTLDNSSNTHIVSTFVIAPAQLSYK